MPSKRMGNYYPRKLDKFQGRTINQGWEMQNVLGAYSFSLLSARVSEAFEIFKLWFNLFFKEDGMFRSLTVIAEVSPTFRQ